MHCIKENYYLKERALIKYVKKIPEKYFEDIWVQKLTFCQISNTLGNINIYFY